MSMYYQSPFFKWLVKQWLATFFLMGIGFVAFGVVSLNLVQLFAANANFIFENGLMALLDGGLVQLLQLVFTAYLAVAFYLLFKTCEHALVERLAHYNNTKE
ncbi:MAG: hypothetical protein ACKVOO_03710 [Burkholderiaceae bacterium]